MKYNSRTWQFREIADCSQQQKNQNVEEILSNGRMVEWPENENENESSSYDLKLVFVCIEFCALNFCVMDKVFHLRLTCTHSQKQTKLEENKKWHAFEQKVKFSALNKQKDITNAHSVKVQIVYSTWIANG